MEKSWENFWATGKVEDYLNYRNRAFEEEPGLSMRGDKQRETKDYENGIITNESVGKGENKHTWDSQCL